MAHPHPAGGAGGSGIYHNGIASYPSPQPQDEAYRQQYQRQQYQAQYQQHPQHQQPHHNHENKVLHESLPQYSQRAFTLDEALPYTPFTSVFPFESGKSYLPDPLTTYATAASRDLEIFHKLPCPFLEFESENWKDRTSALFLPTHLPAYLPRYLFWSIATA